MAPVTPDYEQLRTWRRDFLLGLHDTAKYAATRGSPLFLPGHISFLMAYVGGWLGPEHGPDNVVFVTSDAWRILGTGFTPRFFMLVSTFLLASLLFLIRRDWWADFNVDKDEATRRVIRNSPAQTFADLHTIVSKVLISARRA